MSVRACFVCGVFYKQRKKTYSQFYCTVVGFIYERLNNTFNQKNYHRFFLSRHFAEIMNVKVNRLFVGWWKYEAKYIGITPKQFSFILTLRQMIFIKVFILRWLVSVVLSNYHDYYHFKSEFIALVKIPKIVFNAPKR